VVYFQKDMFALRIINNIAILITFGAIFPPLAVVLCVALFIHTYVLQLQMGRFLVVNPSLCGVVNAECRGMAELFASSVWLLAPVAAVFYSFFIFDTLGDQTGWRDAMWAIAVMSCVPGVIWGGYFYFWGKN
jgi:hypothetical protein